MLVHSVMVSYGLTGSPQHHFGAQRCGRWVGWNQACMLHAPVKGKGHLCHRDAMLWTRTPFATSFKAEIAKQHHVTHVTSKTKQPKVKQSPQPRIKPLSSVARAFLCSHPRLQQDWRETGQLNAARESMKKTVCSTRIYISIIAHMQ